ncbi:MAG: VWA domain-containing protein [Acidobacteria bacterium]|nr:VWA domain-containing protein [Acidobacteriota bacterium]
MRRAALLLTAAILCAQQETQEGPLIRVTVSLVQVDAIVTDKDGRVVTVLTPADFEVLQDGKPQRITRFSYIATQEGPTPRPTKQQQAKGAVPIPPVTVRPDQVRRTMVFLVDDLSLSFESVYYVREALKKFIASLQPGDMVSLMRTGSSSGAFQNFTNDHQQIAVLAETLRWNPRSRTGVNSIRRIDDSQVAEDADQEAETQEDVENAYMNQSAGLGAFGTLNWVMNGLRSMPGRKSIVLISEGFQLTRKMDRPQGLANPDGDLLDPVQRMTELATRAGVVLYTVDPRGLQALNITAADNVRPNNLNMRAARRQQDFADSQSSLRTIAEETGGKAFLNDNDVAGSLRKVLDDQSGFYLLAYDPSDSTFNRKYHKITVRVKRKGLQVRSRSGFMGVEDKPEPPAPKLTKEQQLVAAIKNPFHKSAIPVKLTGIFVVDEKLNQSMNTLLHVDLRQVKFKDTGDGKQHAAINVLVAGFDADGNAANHTYDTFNINVENAKFDEARKRGMMLAVRYPVKRAGPYQLRAVIRDAETADVGSASQFLVAPNLANKRMSLSSLLLGEMPKDDQKVSDRLTMASRIFAPGTDLAYTVQIYNPPLDAQGNSQLTLQLRIFEEGKQVYEGKESPLQFKSSDKRAMTASGVMRLGPNMRLGDYALQVAITATGGKKPVRLTQWTDFHVAR